MSFAIIGALIGNFVQEDEQGFGLVLFELLGHLAHDPFEIAPVVDGQAFVDDFAEVVDSAFDTGAELCAPFGERDDVPSSVLPCRQACDELVSLHTFERVGQGGLFNVQVLGQLLLGDAVLLPKVMKDGQIARMHVVGRQPHCEALGIQSLEPGKLGEEKVILFVMHCFYHML